MRSSQPEHAARWYEDKVRRFGFDHRGLGFRNRSSQEKRFEAMLSLGDFNGRRVLDVGCGFGDFLAFLIERDIHPLYTGLDVCEPMIERCEERFPSGAGRFLAGDVLAFEPEEPYDYVVASGLFGLDGPGARERILPSVARMLEWCRIGAAVNFLSASYKRQVPGRVYVHPALAVAYAVAHAPAIRLDHTYLPNDFTLYLYKTTSWTGAEERNR
ncbi:MAG TPA: class I SAM-dependent methyltransferase [Usitatibacter sp.]|nr:class I SAM-dependent methyltransferase [Usitatibacter sp.]